ncbi:hypothetical protein [Priestia megaterium]
MGKINRPKSANIINKSTNEDKYKEFLDIAEIMMMHYVKNSQNK